jgi:hypothetical protein
MPRHYWTNPALVARGKPAYMGTRAELDMHRLLTSLLTTVALCGVSVGGSTANAASSVKTTSPASPQAAPMLLKLGDFKTDPALARLSGALQVASRQALGELPGVTLMDRGVDTAAAVAKRKPPVLLITGKLVELGQKRSGKEVLISAKVEYFVHRMPGESIAAVVSGVATARVAPVQTQKRLQRERLERSIVTAAVESAARRAPPALLAAMK